jgi:hypothetical protein
MIAFYLGGVQISRNNSGGGILCILECRNTPGIEIGLNYRVVKSPNY